MEAFPVRVYKPFFIAKKTEAATLFQTNITHFPTLFQANQTRIIQKFSVSMTDFLLLSTLLEIKTTPQTTEIPRKPLPLHSTSVL